MNETIIRNHNQRVKPDDLVFHNGDFCFKGGKEGGKLSAKKWEEKLNGKIIHIQGNHDNNNSTKTPILGTLLYTGGKRIYLCHKPRHINSFSFPYDIYFVGHVHNNWKYRTKICRFRLINLINIGVDVNNFMPKSVNEIFKEFKNFKRNNKIKSLENNI